MIICKLNEGIGLRWREGIRTVSKIVPHSEFQPYMYADVQNKMTGHPMSVRAKDNNGSFTINIDFDRTEEVNLNGDTLYKVTWRPNHSKYSKDVRIALESKGINTYEGDVSNHYRYAVDNIKQIPEQNMRKWYWDMEWQQGGKYDEAITCIVIYDNYDDDYHIFAWYPTRDVVLKDSDNFTLHRYTSEHNMLTGFLAYIMDKEPDMLISWFGWKFDIPKLFTRMVHHGIDPRLLSPFDEITGIGWKKDKPTLWKKRIENYSPVYQPIKGLITVALDFVFERQWNDAQRGTLPSLALDYISETILGDNKLVSEKFPDKNDFFRRAWLEDADTYLEYAYKDVELIKRIDDENHCVDAVIALQQLLIAPFDACFYASNMGGIYFMRNASWKAPTGKQEERRSYDGAMVYNPLSEGTNGLHHNVAAFDFAQLYPSMIISRNISWETKSNVPTEFAVNLATPRDFSEVQKKDMMYFKTDELGLLPKAVLELKELRDEYKKNMKSATTKDEKIKWYNNQLAVKRISASFYGITAYQGFGWADIDLAASITASAREAIRAAAFKVREL